MGIMKDLRYIFSPLVSGESSSRKEDKIEIGQGQKKRRVYLSWNDKEAHVYMVGSSGTGKSRLLQYMAAQEMEKGQGLAVADLHGDLFNSLLEWAFYITQRADEKPSADSKVYSKRTQEFLSKVIIVDPADGERTIGFNPLEIPEGKDPYPYVLELIGVFKKLWEEAWGQRMEDILRNTLLLLCEKGYTMLEIPRLLTDKAFRSYLLRDLKNQQVKEYWEKRFDPLAARTKAEWIESTLNKVSTFISDPLIRDIVGQKESTINLREIMDKGQILLINLAKGRLKENSHLLGALFVSKIQEATMSRVDIPLNERRRFYLLLDEFQNFATKSFEEILSEARKYGLSIIMANQNLAQLNFNLKASVLSNAKVQVYFRVNREDAEILAKQIFLATGKNIKYQLFKEKGILSFSEPRSNPVYESVQEEWENYIAKLISLKPRYAYVQVKGEKPTSIRTIDTPEPARLLGCSGEKFYKLAQEFKKLAIVSYTRPRAEIKGEIERRRRDLEAQCGPGKEPQTYKSKLIDLDKHLKE